MLIARLNVTTPYAAVHRPKERRRLDKADTLDTAVAA